MTQEEFIKEREDKEKQNLKFVDMKNPSGTHIRIFKDGTGYPLSGMGGRLKKFDDWGVWDYDAPNGTLQFSRADKKYAEENEIYTVAWKSLQQD